MHVFSRSQKTLRQTHLSESGSISDGPSPASPMTSSDELSLTCFVLGDNPSQRFPVQTSRASTITLLAQAIVATYKLWENVELAGLELFQCSFTPEQVPTLQADHGQSPLSRYRFVKDYWPEQSDIDHNLIHVLVVARDRPRAAPAARQTPSTGELTDTFKKLSIAQEATRKVIQNGPSASAAAQPNTFKTRQEKDDTPIYNGRPWKRTGRPIEIFHPVFRIFLRDLHQVGTVSARDYRLTEELLRASQDTYSDEGARRNTMVNCLIKLLICNIDVETIKGCTADGVIKIRDLDNALQAYCSILEFKNEIGSGHCDPSIQGAESYAKYWFQDVMTPITNLSCCPSFIIAVAGPWMCILGAISLSQIVVQPLTEMLWVADHPQKESRMKYLTQVFLALRGAISHLHEYYRPLLRSIAPPYAEDPSRFYPDIRAFRGHDGREIKFSYTGDIARLAFKAQTDDHRDVVVKFVERYNPPAHQLLASVGLAPKLLFDGGDIQYGGYRMVVMEFIHGQNLSDLLEEATRIPQARGKFPLIRRNIEKALKLLHEANFVFGDLRAPNVIVVEHENGDIGVKLIDFDWCSPVGEGHYPANLNDTGTIKWAAGVERAGLMVQKHDTDMLERLFIVKLSSDGTTLADSSPNPTV
ncbi:unnamed protein product [Rhizoctonia solani]|uniref:Protein kinase domain-containing protein n=1 Tax=Rhizoctonia solani TaxID=456999 RepID=A0A8H3CSR0_9AGAM|nr:unnamed protein product [Rhizoctonia solani]